MNAKSLLIAALGFVAAGAAFATSKSDAERQQEAQLRQPSQVLRAAVQAELAQARIAGTLNVHPDHGTRAVGGASRITRAQVLAELDAARANGTLNVHPDYGNRSFQRAADHLRTARVGQ